MFEDEENNNELDAYTIDAVVCKANDRRIYTHSEFETVCAKYWKLLRTDSSAKRASDTVEKEMYTQLLKRIYKVLLPLYREDEIKREVSQEWIYDSRGQPAMNIVMFQKMLFRIAHAWATHIDLEEYVELLEKVYDRITCKKIIRGESGKVEVALPRIEIEIFQEKEEDDLGDWVSCLSDEYEDQDFEYKHMEDPNDPSTTKRYKRAKPDNNEDEDVMLTSREPFMYREEVQYFRETKPNDPDSAVAPLGEKDISIDVLADLEDVFPMGYPTEQFICKLKNDIIQAFIKLKEDRRKAVAEMRRQMFEDGAKIKVERPPEIQRDPGLLDAQGYSHEEFFSIVTAKNDVRIATLLKVQDKVYNQLRQLFKDVTEISIRPHFNFPSKQVLKGSAPQKILGSLDPVTQVNENMYNCALERRLCYKSIMCEFSEHPKSMCINVNYLIEHPVYETAFRSDVNRIETSGKMSIKPIQEGEITQPHEFVNVTTSFQETMVILLSFKFQTFWTAKVSDKQTDLEKNRDQKTYEQEKQRKAQVLLKDSLTAKNLVENFDEKNYLKLMKGPFYNLMSREGSREDDFVNCTTRDLIDSANAELMKILILGKPRSGKTTLAKALAERLDLVRISPDVWLDDLFARIKDREENPPEEEEEEEEQAEEEAPKEEEEPELDEEGNPIPKPEKVEEEPAEPEVPKRDKKDMWLTDLEYEVRNALLDGQAITLEQIDEIVDLMVNSPLAQTKGFVLDLTFAKNEEEVQWGTRLIENSILAEQNELTHIIEIMADDEEVKRRSESILIKPASGIPFSKWERDERNKPVPVVLDENGDPVVEEEEMDEEEMEKLVSMGLKGPLNASEMVLRSCDSVGNFNREVEYYNMRERNIFDEFIVKLFDSTYIKVDMAGLSPEEITESVITRLKPNKAEPLRPIASIIEDGAGSFKELLTAGQDDGEEDSFNLPRQWSLWKTIDPVSLKKGQVEVGSPEFAAHFANNVFVFQNEENLKEFVKQPRLYIEQAPEMPKDFRLLMTGPRGIGVRTQAALLEDLYGWRVVDFKQIVQEKLKEILAMPVKPPNNITDEGECMICLSEQELNDIKEGKPFPSWKFLPWIMEFLGIDLRVKDPPPPEEDSVTDEEWDEGRLKQHRDKIKKKKKEAEAAAKAAAEAAAAKAERAAKRKEALEQGLNLEELGLQESEDEKVIEDVPIDYLVLQENEDGSLPDVNRFILIGFPQTETHCQKLKEFNIDFDRVIFLSEEDNEEEPGKEVTERMTQHDGVAYDWAAELEIANALMATIKEYLGEENEGKIMEMKDLSGSIEEAHFKIRSRLDPFFTRPDDTTDDIRTSADYEEEEIHRMPRSDFGDFCPVTYVDDGYLVKGQVDEDGGEPNELYVHGKRYFFAGAKEMEKFKKEPSKYMIVQNQKCSLPILPPAPKIMITGNKCAGVTTQINLLCEKFKLEQLELQAEFKKKQAEELKARQRKRLLERGFKGIPEPEDEDAEPEVDTEIVEDPEDFDKGEQDVKDLRSIIDVQKGLVIDGNWRASGEDEEYAIPDLMKNSRRMPEIVVVLKCKEEVSIKRNLADCEEDLKAEFERRMEKREADKVKARQEARDEKLKELEEGEYEEMSPAEIEAKKKEEMDAWDEARDEQEREEDENDEEKPDLEKMKEDAAEALKTICEQDETNLETLKTKLVEEWKAVEVCELDTSKISAEFVHIKLLDLLKNHIKYRKDLIERAQAVPVKPNEVTVYEQSYTYKHSKFGVNSPISPFNPQKTKQHTVLYRERLYFLSDEEEQKEFLLEPSKYVLSVESIPLDVKITPKVVVQGLPKSGKTSLCTRMAEVTGAVHLQMEEIIENFVDRDSSFAAKVCKKLKFEGRDLDDLLLVQLIQKRVGMADCVSRGWILEGFPNTRSQAILMAKKSLLPTNVIVINVPFEEVYKRSASLVLEEFGCNRTILKRRLDFFSRNMPQMVFFFQKFYNNVTSVDGLKSKWYMEDVAVGAIKDNIKARMLFAKDYQHAGTDAERPCLVNNLNIDRYFFKQSLSQFNYFCPVSWKNNKSFVTCTHLPELAVLYKNLFYYFADEKQRDLFVRNPRKFTENVIFSSERATPRRLYSHKAAEISETEKCLNNYCPVTLTDQEKLEFGNHILVVAFKGEKYCFTTEEKLQKFVAQPSRYSKTQLPVKIPPEQKPVPLYNLQKEDNSITFLEQALGSVVTKGLREIGEQRLKYPTLTVKETMLKLFAIFLKTENPANTEHMKQKYMKKMRTFLEKCTVPEELSELASEKKKKKKKNKWPQFKEDYYNSLGQKYDKILHDVEKEKAEGFWGYMK